MAWMKRLGTVVMGGAVLLAAGLALQNGPARAADDPPQVDNFRPGTPKRLSAEELGRLRMLEIQSGAFRDARAAAQSQQLVGPPLSDREKVQHVLNRMSFGAKPGQVEKILQEGGITDQWQAYVKEQLNPDAIDDSALDAQIKKQYEWFGLDSMKLKEKYPYRNNANEWRTLTRELPQSVVVRAAMSKRQFKEVMVEFWRNHFCIDNSPQEYRARSVAAIDYEESVIRANAFGKFKNMLFGSAKHAAMLEYLDNRLSRRNAWNENYARELMELHTVGVDNGYTDQDVLQLSLVLTGWNYDDSYNFAFRANDHQPGPKRVMSWSIPEGYQGGELAIYKLATDRKTAEFVVTKLCKYLVNDAPPADLVKRVVAVWMKTEGDLPKVYEAIIMDPQFFDRGNYRSKFKTPFEFVVGSLRVSDAKVEDAATICRDLTRMGMEIYNCPDPTGYYDRAEAWLDSGVLTSRWDFAFDLSRGKGATPSSQLFAKYKGMKSEDMYKALVRELIGDDIGDKTRQALKAACDEGDVARAYSVLLGSPSFQQQ